MAEPKNKEEDQNAIPPETDWPKPSIRPPRQWSAGLKQFISNFGLLIVIIVGFIIIIGCIYLLYDIIRIYFDTGNEKQFAELRNSLFILAALVGVPFFVWRTMLAAEQTKTAEKQATIAQEKSYTELFAKAIEQLGSVKQVGKDEYVPNIEVRVGALYALERIMHDSEKDAPAIKDTLSVYVQENSSNLSADKKDIGSDLDEIEEHISKNRLDVQTASKILGRRYKTKVDDQEDNQSSISNTRETIQEVIDLSKSDLSNASLEKSNFSRANLQRVNFQDANLQGAELQWAKLQGANLQGANLQGANLNGAKLQGANLQGANLNGAKLQGAELKNVQITDAHKTAASVIWVDFTKAKYDLDKLQEQVMDMFGHKTLTILPEGMKVPDHWSEADMDTADGREQYKREWETFKKEKGVE